MSITCESSAIIGTGTQKATMSFEFARISFSDWGKSTDANGLVMQTMWFDAEFSATDGKTISAEIINTITTQY